MEFLRPTDQRRATCCKAW